MIVYDNDNYKERYNHLNNSYHNYLRISRILTCLEIFDKHNYSLSFLKHLIWTTLITKETINAKESLIRFWINRVKDSEKFKTEDQDELIKLLIDDYHKEEDIKYKRNEIENNEINEIINQENEII